MEWMGGRLPGPWWAGAPLWIGMGWAVVRDLRTRTIPNLLTGTLACAGVATWWATGGVAGLVGSAAGLVVTLALGVVPFARGWLGAGDVKLLAAAAAWVGLLSVPRLLLWSAVAGGVVCLSGLAGSRLANRARGTTRPLVLPYGPAIALGALLTVAEVGT